MHGHTNNKSKEFVKFTTSAETPHYTTPTTCNFGHVTSHNVNKYMGIICSLCRTYTELMHKQKVASFGKLSSLNYRTDFDKTWY